MSVLAATLGAQTIQTLTTNGLHEPHSVAVNLADNTYYFTDSMNARIMQYDPSGTLSVLTEGGMVFPEGLVFAPARGAGGSLVVADASSQQLWSADLLGNTPVVLAGSVLGTNDGVGVLAQFNYPVGLALDGAGNILIADSKNNAVRKMDSTNLVTTVTSVTNGLYEPAAVAVDDAGRLFVADTRNHVIKLVTTNGVTIIAGRLGVSGSQDATPGTNATFQFPRALLWVGGQTGLLVSDSGNHTIRRVVLNPSGTRWTVDTFAGVAGQPGLVDGPLLNGARLNSPRGMARDAEGAIILADLNNDALRRILLPVQSTPLVTPASGAYNNSITLVVTSAVPNVVFRYTTSGAAVNPFSPITAGTVPLLTGGPVPFQVRSYASEYLASTTVSNYYSFFVDPLQFSVPGGTRSNSVSVGPSTLTAGATIRYTTDGSTPTTNSTPWVDGTYEGNRLLARGFRDGFDPTPVLIFSNYFNFVVATPVVTPSGTTTNSAADVTISCDTVGADLYWTIDGSEPTKSSAHYAGKFTLGTNGTLKVKGFKDGYADSPTVSSAFNLVVATPVIVPNGTVANNDVSVTISNATAGTAFYWTVDGTDPETNNGALYTGPFTLGTNGTLKVKGFKSGFAASPEASAVFNLGVATPVVTPAGMTANNATDVTMSCDTVGADLYWTIDGSEPTKSSAHYSGKFTLGTKGTLKVKGFKNGYADSATVSSSFNLFVDLPVISPSSPNGVGTNNGVLVTITDATLGAALHYTIDGNEPTNGSPVYSVPFTLGTTALLKVKGFTNGFANSATASNMFNLFVDLPVISPSSPNGVVTNNDVLVTFTDATLGAALHYTIDGNEPTNGSPVYSAPFTLGTSALLKVKGFTNGFANSVTASNMFNLYVETPVVTADTNTYTNTFTVTASDATALSELRYTLDGTSPTNSSYFTALPLTLTTNTVLKMVGVRSGYSNSAIVTRNYQVQVDKPTMSPSGGFFPEGTLVSLSVARPDAKIYYTLNGRDPTPSDSLYTAPFLFSQVYSPGLDLSTVKARAFATNTLPSDIVSGQSASTNVNGVGVARDVNAGIGSTVVLPITVSLQSNVVLKSVQFRAEVSPVGSAPALVAGLQVLGIGTNDFAQVPGPGSSSGVIHWEDSYYQLGNTNGVSFVSRPTAIGPDAELVAKGNEVLVLLVVTIPRTAAQGARYHVEILQPSGTSDGQQQSVPLVPLPGRTITVTNIAYLVGDSSPGAWYNAGDFGNGDLDNSDVNNAAYASAGYHVPPSYTDVFDAMDAFPPDIGTVAGGDGEIRYLDWQFILLRSLRLDTNNYHRSWSASGRVSQTTVLPSGAKKKSLDAGSGPGLVWFRHAKVYATGLTNVVTGSACAMPVYVDVASGYALAGLQFRAIVLPEDGTALPVGVTFTSALTDPYFNVSSGNGVFCAWNAQGNSAFNPKLAGSGNLLGYLHIPIPQSGGAGYHYTVRFVGVDGSDAIPLPYDPMHLPPQYNLESVPAGIWVLGAVGSPPEIISDEWKTNFFGSVNSTNAISTFDYDGDGMPNWHEYLAGTDPTSKNSCLKFLQTSRTNGALPGVVVQWLSAPGKSYAVDRSTGLKNPTWTPVASGVAGNGFPVSITDTNPPGKAQFYRIRLEP